MRGCPGSLAALHAHRVVQVHPAHMDAQRRAAHPRQGRRRGPFDMPMEAHLARIQQTQPHIQHHPWQWPRPRHVKPIAALLEERGKHEGELKRSLGLFSLTALGIGAIIGTGIFVLTGLVAARYAGPGIIISFVLAAFVSALAALCYAEFASIVPISGSAYTYAYATLGELIAWMIGWDLILEYGFAAAAVSIGWSAYLSDFLSSAHIVSLPKALVASPFAGGIINLPATIAVLLLTALLILGTSLSSRVNAIMVIIKLSVIAFFLVIGFKHIAPVNWTPFLPYGIAGIFQGASIIFFAYIGFDMISTSAEEARNPSRDLPRAIIVSLAICTLLYIVVAATLTGIVPYTQLDVASPVSHALIQVGLDWAGSVISTGVLCGLTTVLLVLLYGQSRIFFSMARDGLLPTPFARIHPRFHTPHLSSILVGIMVALLAGLTPINVVAELTNIGTLAAFALVSLGVLILRRTQPDLPRPFRVPLVPFLPILSVLASLVLIAGLPLVTLVRFVVWLAVGLVIYFAYGRRASHLRRHEAEAEQAPSPPPAR